MSCKLSVACISGALKGMEIGLFTGISVDAKIQIQLRAMTTNMLWLNIEGFQIHLLINQIQFQVISW